MQRQRQMQIQGQIQIQRQIQTYIQMQTESTNTNTNTKTNEQILASHLYLCFQNPATKLVNILCLCDTILKLTCYAVLILRTHSKFADLFHEREHVLSVRANSESEDSLRFWRRILRTGFSNVKECLCSDFMGAGSRCLVRPLRNWSKKELVWHLSSGASLDLLLLILICRLVASGLG